MEIARPQANASAGANSVSLYQQCMVLIEKLYSLPDFEYYLFPQGVDALIDNPSLLDPVAVIWACFRLGAPFCQLYNQLRPRKRLQVPDLPSVAPPYNNSCKKAVYEFIVACKAELQMEESELFSISGLYKDDTNEFVKLMKTVSIVVKKVEDANLFPPPRPLPFSTPTIDPTAPSDNRAKLIAELLNTERVYTADLEKLQRYKRELNSQNIVPRDTLLHLFANLDELLDFQRRFLLQMEATLSLPIQEQRIGQLFMQNEEAFSVYVPFCGNYQFSTQTAMENAVQLQRVTTMDPLRELPSYLIRPVQRACKYPLLLNELIKYSDESTYPFMNELQEGLAAIKRVTDLVNEQKRQEENRRVKQDVIDRVEDWKGLNIGEFGDLLLSDKFPMSTGEAERDYELYLFERILLCCKDTTKKRKSKKGVKDDTTTYSLKGNIYIERIDSVANESNPVTQKFQLKVFWRDGMDMESFVLRCRNVEQMKLWNGRLDTLIQTERMRK
ncbi:Dbl homology domain-containing protein, partial [Phlyctochytrium arcticum]